MEKITIKDFLENLKDRLGLVLIAGESGLKKTLETKYLNRPSMALMGWYKVFAYHRIQVFGKTELTYLKSLGVAELRKCIEKLLEFDIPCLIISRNLEPPATMIELANIVGIPLIVSKLRTVELIDTVSAWLDDFFAPSISVHGTMVDVFGVGILLTGKSGIGKSECALALVEKGHRLVADDVVVIKRFSDNILKAYPTELQGHYMEIRGVGLIDLEKLFGVQAIRLQKRLELNIHLSLWNEVVECDRIGLTEKTTTYLNVQIPKITIPISPGKNIAVILEVIATNFMMKIYGENLAESFVERVEQAIKRKRTTGGYLLEDNE